MRLLLILLALKAATVIVSGNAGTSAPQDLVMVGVGTGVVVARIDATHYAVVTAAHVARYGDPQVAVYGHAGARTVVDREILDPRGEDLAMLIVHSRTPLPVVPIADRNPPEGDLLPVIGHPFAHTWLLTHARYMQGSITPDALLQPLVTADSDLWICRGCDRGNSGSGIYDAQGRLVAVIYAAAPLPGYSAADAREVRMDEYNPRIVRQVLAIDYPEVRSLLAYSERIWHNKGPHSQHP